MLELSLSVQIFSLIIIAFQSPLFRIELRIPGNVVFFSFSQVVPSFMLNILAAACLSAPSASYPELQCVMSTGSTFTNGAV